MRALAAALRVLQAWSPPLAARVAERLFFTPPRTGATAAVRAFLATGRRFELLVEGRRVVGWRWKGRGQEAPIVYLVHGWGGRGGRLAPLASPLLAAGYTVVTFDAPGHGASGRGMSSMPEFARALAAVVARHGPAHAVVAHSLGGAATALAMSWGLESRRAVFLAPPLDPVSWLTPFSRALGLRPDVITRMQARSERRLRFRWAQLHVGALARAFSIPLLVVHDRDDDTVAYSDGCAIAAAWPGARLITTQGLGHRGVVRAPGVLEQVAAFVMGGAAEPLVDRFEEAALLEYELFHRESR